MISTSEELAETIRAGGYVRQFVADLIVDGERKLKQFPLASCELVSNGNAKVRHQGTATLVYSDELGQSIVPEPGQTNDESITSWMTPYASFLVVYMKIGSSSELVLQGTYKIVGVGDPKDTKVRVGDRLLSVGSRVTLSLADRFSTAQREKFFAPTSPSQTASTWQEIGIVSGLVLARNVADSAITREVTFRDNVLDAMFDLAGILDGVPYMNPLDQVAVQPNVWGAEQEPLTLGEDGTVTAVNPDQLVSDDIYNIVVVRSRDDEQERILATAPVLAGPLRYGGPFGRIPYFPPASEYATDEASAQVLADSLLPQVSTLPAASYVIQCVPDPRREVGDVIPFERNGEMLIGRAVERTLASAGPMTLRVLVDRG